MQLFYFSLIKVKHDEKYQKSFVDKILVSFLRWVTSATIFFSRESHCCISNFPSERKWNLVALMIKFHFCWPDHVHFSSTISFSHSSTFWRKVLNLNYYYITSTYTRLFIDFSLSLRALDSSFGKFLHKILSIKSYCLTFFLHHYTAQVNEKNHLVCVHHNRLV